MLDIEVSPTTATSTRLQEIIEVADDVCQDPMGDRVPRPSPRCGASRRSAATASRIRLVVKTLPADQYKVMRELQHRIKDAFDAEGIEIPFPQQTIWVAPPSQRLRPTPTGRRRADVRPRRAARPRITLDRRRRPRRASALPWRASRTSSAASASAARRSAVSRTTAVSTSARSERLASVLALRTSRQRVGGDVEDQRVAVAGAMRPRSASGHGARWTEPSCHHDHTSSVTKGRNGANSRSSVDSATASAAWADADVAGGRRRPGP